MAAQRERVLALVRCNGAGNLFCALLSSVEPPSAGIICQAHDQEWLQMLVSDICCRHGLFVELLGVLGTADCVRRRSQGRLLLVLADVIDGRIDCGQGRADCSPLAVCLPLSQSAPA
jgi:hypothetical protein